MSSFFPKTPTQVLISKCSQLCLLISIPNPPATLHSHSYHQWPTLQHLSFGLLPSILLLLRSKMPLCTIATEHEYNKTQPVSSDFQTPAKSDACLPALPTSCHANLMLRTSFCSRFFSAFKYQQTFPLPMSQSKVAT